MRRRIYGYRNLKRFLFRVFLECKGKGSFSAANMIVGRMAAVKEDT
ncbi:hypothetical protein [Fervidibacillus halotolerans]|uniref:Uncharacterized protein n=1 Tax=Fervidibacillus halotolerans TaxID=2980027 RepID=A0A9E8M1S4_9BACI|nr:hypothetical protein [Fervidibacillus halotolerans]WAA13885.1 hypothetical protein OE105_04410 [Fervidibacillus halotolerans]